MAKILREANYKLEGEKTKKLYKKKNVISVFNSPTANNIFMVTIM